MKISDIEKDVSGQLDTLMSLEKHMEAAQMLEKSRLTD